MTDKKKTRPGLYGLNKNNCNRKGSELWGKNQFNSSFPLALCLRMRDDDIPAVYIRSIGNGHPDSLDFTRDLIDIADVVGREKDSPSYFFETSFEPFAHYTNEDIDKIDLVINKGGTPFRPLEIKLTVVPDSSTCQLKQSQWAPEIVLRPISSAYAMMNIYHQLQAKKRKHLLREVRATLKPICDKIRNGNWNNSTVILHNAEDITNGFCQVIDVLWEIQEPFLVQPIWRTDGKSFILSKNCFDVFVWSDLAIMAIPLIQFYEKDSSSHTRVSRYLREVARHVCSLYKLCTNDSFQYNDTYGGMALDLQTDKSFSISGKVTHRYMSHDRLRKPRYPASILPDIILGGGESNLSPERRLDAAVVAAHHLFA